MNTQLRIGIDGEALKLPLSGVGHYVYNLCEQLESLLPEAHLFVYSRLAQEKHRLPSTRWVVRQEPVAALRKLPSFLWLKTVARRLIVRDRLTHFWGGRTILPSLGPGTRLISTVHDLNHVIVPETMQRVTRISHQLWFDSSVKKADVVVSNSRGTAARLFEHTGRQADLVVVPGISQVFLDGLRKADQGGEGAVQQALFGFDAPYLLAVGTLEPRKNISALIEAFLALKQDGVLTNHKLVLVGARGWGGEALERLLKTAEPLGLFRAGYVADELLPSVYRSAALFVCPSTYEGFGMPAREAWISGTPSVVSRIPELLEAASPGSLFVEPELASIKAGIKSALTSSMPQAASHPSGFTWQDSAKVFEIAFC